MARDRPQTRLQSAGDARFGAQEGVDMTTGTAAGDGAERSRQPDSICWCCGADRPDSDLVRLGAHPEVGVCTDCAVFLHRRARTAHASGVSRQLYAVGERARDGAAGGAD